MRKDFLKDVRLNANNKYEYMGGLFTWSADKSVVIRLYASVLIGVVFEVISGCLPASGANGHPWILIPLAIAMIMAAILAWRTLQLVLYREVMKEFQRQTIENWFPASSFFLTVGAVVSAVASIVTDGFVSLYPWCQLLAAAGGAYAYILFKAITWEKVSKN